MPAVGVSFDLLGGSVPALGNAVGLVVLETVLEIATIVLYGVCSRCNLGNHGSGILSDPVTKVEALEGVLLYIKDGEKVLVCVVGDLQFWREREGAANPFLVPFGLSSPVLFVVASGSAEDLGAILQVFMRKTKF